MRRLLCLLFLAGVAAAQPAPGQKRERIRLMHADSLVSRVIDDQEVVTLIGNVRMIQGEAHLNCHHARLWQDDNRALLTGDVVIFDGKRTLRAHQVDYSGTLQREQATGRVELITGPQELLADELIWWQKKEVAEAEGHVTFTDPVENAVLFGGKAYYDRLKEYGRVEIEPRLVKIDSVAGDSLIVLGEKMEAWGQTQTVLITDSVSIEKGDMLARCQRAVYRSGADSLFLEITPRVVQRGQIMSGDTIAINLADTRFQGGRITGQAKVLSRVRQYEDVMTGKSITLVASDDTLRQVIVNGQAGSVYHVFDEDSLYQGVNTVTGDRITLKFEAGRMNRIEVASEPGESEGTFKPPVKQKKKDSEPHDK